MLWTYEDGDYNSSVSMEIDSDDIKYDAEYMNIFMEQLTDDVKWYVDRARTLEKSYVKYHNNETFVGQMAEYSKRFIYEIQGDELHIKNLELKKDFLYACSNIEERFKEQVDPSPKSRISTRVLLKIKRDFGTYYAVIDTKGYEIECHAKRLVDWKDLELFWNKLQDEQYNVEMVALVLKLKANNCGFDINNLSDEQRTLVFKGYNGSGDQAAAYGVTVQDYYNAFSEYNDQ